MTTNQVEIDKDGVKITFHGWKSKNSRRSLIFPFMKDTDNEDYKAISQYLKVCGTFVQDGVMALFIDDDGKQMIRPVFNDIWHHVVDHSSYRGLNVTLHSMRIGGATMRQMQKMETKEIMRLGRWQDEMVNSYIRPDLVLPPEQLRKIPEVAMKRSYEIHYLCDCKDPHGSKATSAMKAKYQKNNKTVTRWRRKGASDTRIMKRMEKIRRTEIIAYKRSQTKILVKIREVHRIAISKFRAKPLIKPYTFDSSYISRKYENDELWFTLAVYASAKRWRRFQQTCKYDVLQQKRGHPGFQGILMFKDTVWKSNIQLLIDDDKTEAKELITEYRNQNT